MKLGSEKINWEASLTSVTPGAKVSFITKSPDGKKFYIAVNREMLWVDEYGFGVSGDHTVWNTTRIKAGWDKPFISEVKALFKSSNMKASVFAHTHGFQPSHLHNWIKDKCGMGLENTILVAKVVGKSPWEINNSRAYRKAMYCRNFNRKKRGLSVEPIPPNGQTHIFHGLESQAKFGEPDGQTFRAGANGGNGKDTTPRTHLEEIANCLANIGGEIAHLNRVIGMIGDFNNTV